MSLRPVKRIIDSKPTMEGAGVRLRRAFGFGNTEEYDPFLLLDDFRNENPEDYLRGFPWHPHRGIETITYVLAGSVEHGDSLGNKGEVTDDDGTKARIICGEFWGKRGPVEGVAADPAYVDISVPPSTRKRIKVDV